MLQAETKYSRGPYFKWDEFPENVTIEQKFHYYRTNIQNTLTREFLGEQETLQQKRERMPLSLDAVERRVRELLVEYGIPQNIHLLLQVGVDVNHEGNAKINITWQ